jgi:hypothetical protein
LIFLKFNVGIEPNPQIFRKRGKQWIVFIIWYQR